MKLFSQSFGTAGPPLLILHGLLGSSDNWQTHAQVFSSAHRVFTLDARNHGRSPHADVFNYDVMADDVWEFVETHGLAPASVLGHSMGGKTAMFLATRHPHLVDRLIVADIAPKPSSPSHDEIFDALEALHLPSFRYRKEIDEALARRIPNFHTRQFVLKNLKRLPDETFGWKMNLEVIRKNYAGINAGLPKDRTFAKPTLFVRGGASPYVQDTDIELIQDHFPLAKVATIPGAGHWLHADAPEEFARIVSDFLDRS